MGKRETWNYGKGFPGVNIAKHFSKGNKSGVDDRFGEKRMGKKPSGSKEAELRIVLN